MTRAATERARYATRHCEWITDELNRLTVELNTLDPMLPQVNSVRMGYIAAINAHLANLTTASRELELAQAAYFDYHGSFYKPRLPWRKRSPQPPHKQPQP